MLDKFLEVACGHTKVAESRQRMTNLLRQLPNEELLKMAHGTSKLSYIYFDGDGKWLDRFKGTPLFDQAIALEQRELELKMKEKDDQQAQDDIRDATNQERDELCIQKKMLELDLAKAQEGGEVEEPEEEEEEEEGEEGEEVGDGINAPAVPKEAAALFTAALEKMAKKKGKKGKLPIGVMAALPVAGAATGAGIRGLANVAQAAQQAGPLGPALRAGVPRGMLRGGAIGAGIGLGTAGLIGAGHLLKGVDPHTLDTAVKLAPGALATYGALRDVQDQKTAAVLTTEAREKIKSKNFAVKGGKYPINDPKHARNALTRVRQFGTPAEKSQVYSAVSKKYPALATRSEVIPEKKQRTAEKKLGLGKGQESQKKEKAIQKVSHDFALASGRMKIAHGVSYEELSEMEKEAFMGAIRAGAKAIGGAAKALGGAGRTAWQQGAGGVVGGGLKGGLQRARNAASIMKQQLPGMAQQAGKWIGANPAAAAGAAGLGAAGIGTAGLGAGYLVGR